MDTKAVFSLETADGTDPAKDRRTMLPLGFLLFFASAIIGAVAFAINEEANP